VIKRPTLRRQTVELGSAAAPRPSRIRREPPPPQAEKKGLQPYPSEREAVTVIVGVILFALAITIAIVGTSNNILN
jgi:hypothetical protein